MPTAPATYQQQPDNLVLVREEDVEKVLAAWFDTAGSMHARMLKAMEVAAAFIPAQPGVRLELKPRETTTSTRFSLI